MDIFISYRRSTDSTERDLRKFLDDAAGSSDLLFERPFLGRERDLRRLHHAMFDLEISRASARAATLIIALSARHAGIFHLSGFSRLLSFISPRINPFAFGASRRPSRNSLDHRAPASSYRNFLSIGFGNAMRASVAIKRLVLLGDADFLLRPDRRSDDQFCFSSSIASHRLFLDELGREPRRGHWPFASWPIAAMALVGGDPRSAPYRLFDGADRRRTTPSREYVTWLVPEETLEAPLSLTAPGRSVPWTFRASVEELRASIVIDSFNSLPASDRLALPEDVRDKKKTSNFVRFNRFLRNKLFGSKTLPKLKPVSKNPSRRKANRTSSLRLETLPTEIYFHAPKVIVPSGFEESQAIMKLDFYIPHLNLLDQSPAVASRLALPDDGIAWSEVSGGEDQYQFDDPDIDECHASGSRTEICGLYVCYRYKLGGDAADRVFREVLEVRAGPSGFLFTMSVADRPAQSPQSVWLCEGEVREAQGALLLVEHAREGGGPGRMVYLFVDPTEECDASASCRIGAVMSRAGPRRRRLRTDSILLVRVRGTPRDRDAFFAQVTAAGPFDELMARDFGNDAADLQYVGGLLNRRMVRHSTGHLAARPLGGAREPVCSDVDVHPFECGLNDIVERALDCPTIAAPFKEGWSEGGAAPAPSVAAKASRD